MSNVLPGPNGLPTLLGVAWSNSVQLRPRSIVAVIVALLAARLARFDRAETSLNLVFTATRTIAGSSHTRAATQFLNEHYNFTSPYSLEPLSSNEHAHISQMYRPTLMRLSCFFVGTLLAMALQRADNSGGDRFGAILKFSLLAASVFVFLMPLIGSDAEWPLAVDIFVTVFLHTVYAAAAAFILFTALAPERNRFAAPWLRAFLSASVFRALSPLTFAVFVLHFRIVFYFGLWALRPSDSSGVTHLFLIKLWLVTVGTSFGVAYLVHRLVEEPAMDVVKRLKVHFK